jgi:hypothetical protein
MGFVYDINIIKSFTLGIRNPSTGKFLKADVSGTSNKGKGRNKEEDHKFEFLSHSHV